MLVFADTLADVITAWPLAFCLGVVVGLAMASRYRIVRNPDQAHRGPQDPK